MTLVALLRKWLVTTPLKGKLAILFAVTALALPTFIRASLDGVVVGLGFSTYFPFVLLAGILLDWELAAGVAVVSAALTDLLFVGSRYRLLDGPTDVFGVVSFLVGAVLIISLVHAVRTAFDDLVGPTSAGGVIFSLKDNQAWASWPAAGFHLSLGPRDDVAEMMKDFVAQVELGKRLTSDARPDTN